MSVTAYKTPGTCATVSRGATPWSNPDNAKTSNDAWATCAILKNALSDWLRATNFGFTATDIPAGAAINGIEVKIERHEDGSAINDTYLYLRKTSGQVGSNKASASLWPNSDGEVTYGGATDTWVSGLIDTDIKSSDFGIDLVAGNTDGSSTYIASVDCISVRVYYTAVEVVIPFRNYYPHILAH